MTTGSGTTIGQVIEATVRDFVVEIYDDVEGEPSLGELIVVGQPGEEAYGVVVDIATAGLDGGRRPAARRRDEEGHERVMRSNPHLAHLLRTTCRALIVAHRRNGGVAAYLPPAPPRIWEAAAPCPPAERAILATTFDVLRPLVVAGPTCDDATAALVRALAADSPEAATYRRAAGKALTQLLASDPPRLVALLRRIRP